MNEEFFQANLNRWNERVKINAQSKFYDLEGFMKGKSSLLPIEVKELGDVTDKTMLHMQCHFGMDSLSWARKGAKVTAVDFAPEAVKLARELSETLEIPAKFIEANIYDIPQIISEKYDIVFTSYGVLCWLPDIKKWAEVIDHCLKPKGVFYIIESHPFGFLVDENYNERFQTGYPYFTEGKAFRYEDETNPIDQEKTLENVTSFEWIHPLSTIINSLIDVGLQIEFVHEYPYSFFPIHPDMKKGDNEYFHFQNKNFNVPMMFSLMAKKKEK
ncbi:MAG: class I SAM-dependent methyltransferase [Candidatus Heimdallarchaeota archaeon]